MRNMLLGDIERETHVSCLNCGRGAFTKVYNVTVDARAEETRYPAYQCVRCGAVMACIQDRDAKRQVVGAAWHQVNVEAAE